MAASRTIAVALLIALVAAPGCVHQMKVKNLNEYQMSAHTARRHTVRLAGPTGLEEAAYREMIRDSLEKHPSIQEVVLANEPQYDVRPDIDVQADVSVKYRGSGANFPITFPGFLLFAHAWNGYVYKADIVTKLTVTPASGAPRTRTLETTYDMRHCDFGRGFWSSSGWYMPGWGATSLLAGFFMISYDTDATPEFSQAVHDAYGAYVANNITAMIAEGETQPIAAASGAPTPVSNAAGNVTKPAATARVASSAPASEPRAAATSANSTTEAAAPATQPTAQRANVAAAANSEDDAYNQRVWAGQAGTPK